MGTVLTVLAVTLCAVRLLEPEQLTPLVERVACRMLDADVSVARVDLQLHPRAPFVKLTIDSLRVISKPMLRLRAAGDTADIPAWADTLLTLERFEGSINPLAALAGRIRLGDVIFTNPAINLFTVNENLSNYMIYTPAPDTAGHEPLRLPSISIDRFSILRPQPLRFSNLSTGEHFTLMLSSLSIDSGGKPVYNLSTGGDVHSPVLRGYNLDRVQFGIDGGIGWDSEHPGELSLSNFRLTADFLDATINARVHFGQDIIVREFDVDLGRIGIERLLSVIPDSIRARYDIQPDRFASDVAMTFAARSTAPFNITTDSIPSADLRLVLEPGMLAIGKARFERVGGVIAAELRGNDLDRATFTVSDFAIEGPATSLLVNAEATAVQSDPYITGTVTGHTDLERLPARIADLAGGFLGGKLTLDVEMRGALSMFERDNFHRIHLKGDVDGRDLFYLANDTNLMVYAHHATFDFGTNMSAAGVDSLLTAVVRVDSTDIIQGDAAMTLGGLTLGFGCENRHNSADTTRLLPMGGRLQLKKFNLEMIDHSTTFRVRDIDGRVSLQRYRQRSRLPLLTMNLGIDRMSVGSATTRLMLNRSQLSVSAHKLPGRGGRGKRRMVDSLRIAHPDMPVDSVYAYARRKHRPNPHKRPRVHPEYHAADSSETIYWGTTRLVKSLLLDWAVEGRMTTGRAGLFTASFPIRNRIENLNVRFCNDSVVLENVRYKAGHSDFLISGRLSNMRQAFTSADFTAPLRINFDVKSDTVDLNQLAGTAMRGAAAGRHTDGDDHHRQGLDIGELELDEARRDSILEHRIGTMVAGAPDSVAPLLIPTNIELQFDMHAANVVYGDIAFTDFSGRLLAYDGALNLHRLAAHSDAGSMTISALYSGARADALKIGFGLDIARFNIGRFLELVPAVDTMAPIMRDLRGIISAEIAATCDLDSAMNLRLPTMHAAIRISGDSLELIDRDTYRRIGRWLMFKDKQRNIIDHMNVEMTVADDYLNVYPFIFNIDRYKLGVQGYNDLAMNLDYHIAVLKSPLPFKFGINIKGTPGHLKIRLGKARLQENLPTNIAVVDTTRVNLIRELENVFRRGVTRGGFRPLTIESRPFAADIDLDSDTISAADSAVFIREGLIPSPMPKEIIDKQ